MARFLDFVGPRAYCLAHVRMMPAQHRPSNFLAMELGSSGEAMLQTKLSRPKAAQRPAGPTVVKSEDSLKELISHRFDKVLESGEWWGAEVVGGEAEALEILAALGASGCRGALVAGRVGLAGFSMILAHPFDAKDWPERQISAAMPFAKRSPALPSLVFKQQSKADFGQKPVELQNNEAHAGAVRLADEMARACQEPEAPRKGASRL